MPKRARQPADGLKAKALPKMDRGGIGADHEIELHSGEPAIPGLGKRVLGKLPRDPAATLGRVGCVGGIGDMVAPAELVVAQEIGADDDAVRLGDEDCRPGPVQYAMASASPMSRGKA